MNLSENKLIQPVKTTWTINKTKTNFKLRNVMRKL